MPGGTRTTHTETSTRRGRPGLRRARPAPGTWESAGHTGPWVAPEGPRTQLLRKRHRSGHGPSTSPVPSGGTSGRARSLLGVPAQGGVPGTHHANARHAQDSAHIRVPAHLSTEPEAPSWGAHLCLPATSQGGPWGADTLTLTARRAPPTADRPAVWTRPHWAGPGRAGPGPSPAVTLRPEGLDLRGQGHWGTAQWGHCFRATPRTQGAARTQVQGGGHGLGTALPSGQGMAQGTPASAAHTYRVTVYGDDPVSSSPASRGPALNEGARGRLLDAAGDMPWPRRDRTSRVAAVSGHVKSWN